MTAREARHGNSRGAALRRPSAQAARRARGDRHPRPRRADRRHDRDDVRRGRDRARRPAGRLRLPPPGGGRGQGSGPRLPEPGHRGAERAGRRRGGLSLPARDLRRRRPGRDGGGGGPGPRGRPHPPPGLRSPGACPPARDRSPGRRPLHRPAGSGHPRSDQAPDQASRVPGGRPRRRDGPLVDGSSRGRLMRVLFYGTPVFALPTLRTLLARHTVVTVVTQPDRPAGRGQRLQPSPVKQLAVAEGLPVLQPPRLRDPAWVPTLRATGAEVAVVVAFGQILPRAVLDVPAHGSINVHASLLPRYRGAAPIAWAIIRGERESGITTFQMDEGMDTGPMLLRRAVAIDPEETAGELAVRLAEVGAEVLLETLDRLPALAPVPQDSGAATLAPRLRKEDGALDWTRPAAELAARVRGVNPWPGAVTVTPVGRLLVWRARAVAGQGAPGVLTAAGEGLYIGSGEGFLQPIEVQPESRRVLSWEAFLRGARLGPGAVFGEHVPARWG